MAKYSAVKATVNAYIKQNGRKEITGRILNAVLNATIDSLGKYFQFAGGALPTDDPGTPDQNVCYLAGEPGVYTNFGGITIENEEVALIFWNGEWTKQRILIGIREVNASVDSQVGTPSVDVSYSGGELVLTFHNLKGEQGETGDPAGFGTIGADINGGVGTPGVSVETSGDNTAKNLMFHFTNLKGETGVTSVVATIDDTSGTPSCQVSLEGQQLTLAFSGLKGLKGDTGVSADYPITIYNGLDSDATDQALSAAQGKVLDGKVSQLAQEVNGKDNSQDTDFAIATGPVDYSKSVDIKAGVYNITVDDPNNALPRFTRIYLNGTSIGYLKSLTNPVTIANDVTTLRLFVNGQATTSGNITIHFEDTQKTTSLDERISSLEETSEDMSEDVNSLKTEVYGEVKMEWYQGNIYGQTGKFSPTNIRVTNLNPLPLPIKVKSSSTIYVITILRFKDGKSPEIGGVKNTDWISKELSSAADTITITKNNEFPNVYITLRKPNSSDLVSVSEVENDITLEYIDALSPRVDELEKSNKSILIDFGTQTPPAGNNTKYIWLDSPVKFSDYSEMIFRTHLSGQMSNQVLLYAIYSQDPNDSKRVLPNVYENVDSIISIPSNDRESLYGLMLYNLNGVSYSFGASLELVSKNESVKYFDNAERSANLLPAYYFADNYIYNKRDIINKYLRENILLGDAFFFVTDTHWEFNQKHSPALIKELSRKLNIQRIFHGGDIYNNSPVVDTFEVDCINSFRDAIGNDKVAVAQGNHEYLGNDTWADVFVEASMHLENAKFGGPNKQYFYIDNSIKKIRYVILYSYGQREGGSYTHGYNDQEQLTWLSGTALNVESGWDIIIFTHYAVSPVVNGDEYTSIAGFENVAAIINGYAGSGRIVAMITGHTHRDYVLLESLDVPIIVTTCDHNANFLYNGVRDFDNLQTPRDSETINEQAFDAVIYDRVNCLFHFIRIGSEADNKMNLLTTNTQVAVRSIYCTTKAVNDTVELPTYLTSGVTWESSDTSVATVSSGTVSCVGVGCVRITATDSNGEKQSFYLKVA